MANSTTAATGSTSPAAERGRLAEADAGTTPWRDWGPYLSERAWGTVREDYSATGDAWSFFPHDHARSRVYRWNEDGMAGFCDETQNWCLALGLWNGVDPIVGDHSISGPLVLAGDGAPEALFCENETNDTRLFGGSNTTPYPKDGINDHVVHGADTVNPAQIGTKAALHYTVSVPAGGSSVIKARLVGVPHPAVDADPAGPSTAPMDLGAGFDAAVSARKAEADQFYASVLPDHIPAQEAVVARQAFAGLLWAKQFFHYDVKRWLAGDPGQPTPPPGRGQIRNGDWRHLNNHEVILMPDPWEYPWFAAWDLAFHCVTLAHIDPAFAKSQLILLLREWYMHPNGQIPAYEWNFSDVNPPVHAWAAIRVFELDGGTDFIFLARIFHKLLINFTWWVDNKDHGGNNLFEGGFMGLDNIAPLDRSALPPSEGYLEQADSTA